jgi:hypothetical protein
LFEWEGFLSNISLRELCKIKSMKSRDEYFDTERGNGFTGTAKADRLFGGLYAKISDY